MTDDELKNILDKATPSPWHPEEKPGMDAMGIKSSIGVWSAHRFNAALDSDDEDIDPEDECWVCGIWGILRDEERANASLIAAAPDLAEEVLRLRAENAALKAVMGAS